MTTPPHMQAQIDQMSASVSRDLDGQIKAILGVREKFGRDMASATTAHVLSEPPYDTSNARLSMLIVALDRLADYAERQQGATS